MVISVRILKTEMLRHLAGGSPEKVAHRDQGVPCVRIVSVGMGPQLSGVGPALAHKRFYPA